MMETNTLFRTTVIFFFVFSLTQSDTISSEIKNDSNITSSAESTGTEDVSQSTITSTVLPSTSETTVITQAKEHGKVAGPATSSSYDKIIYANVCNMSLSAVHPLNSGEEVLKECTCWNMEVSCRFLDITDLPSLLSFPKSYHVANFEGNRISNINSDTFYNGRDIVDLVLCDNKIDFISSKAFQAFKKLRTLNLSHNRIWNLPSSAFEGLSDLRRLDLSFNDFFTVYPRLFAPLYELRQLILESNPLHELQPKDFEHLSKLESLDLESTMLKVIPDHLFVFTPHLKQLDLSNNLLEEVPSEALHALNYIKNLDLSGNHIEVIRSEAFRGSLGPVVLYLDRMPQLKKIEKYAFGDAKLLQELHCSYNFKLEEIDEHAFVSRRGSSLVSLSQLFLRQNQLSSVPRELQPWGAAMELHFQGNPLHCDCNAQWMLGLRLKNDFQADTRCKSPTDVDKVALADLKDTSLHCGMDMSEILLISFAAVLAILVLVMIVAFLTWRRNYRGYTKPYYIPRNNNMDEVDYRGDEDGM